MGYGDELMVSGRARVLQQTDPRKCLVTYRGAPKQSQWGAIWDNNPRIAKVGEAGDFQVLPARDMGNNRPYHTGKTLERWTYNLDFRPDVGEIYFSDDERSFGERYRPQIIVEPGIKPGASPNKQWGSDRWLEFARLATAAGYRLTQLGGAGTHPLQYATLIPTANFRLACAVLARASGYVGHEGGLHHAAAALGIPGVVIFGGFTPVELTGYPLHRNLGASLGEACGMRTPCEHCAAAMSAISPERVLGELTACPEMR
jgi:ADP-heptose:LPS heptosyltransferase